MEQQKRTHAGRDLGTAIRAGREAAGLSLRECADLAGVHYSYLSRLENGENDRPAPDILQRLADVLELDSSTLLRFIGIRPSDTLPPPRAYFRRKLGVNADEADILAKLIELDFRTFPWESGGSATRARSATGRAWLAGPCVPACRVDLGGGVGGASAVL